MSTLVLVRHGQAFPFQRESAALTATGEAQALALARYWLRSGVRFDEVYSGEFPRQIRTEEIVAEAYREAGQAWPAGARDASWNEYDAPGVLRHLVPADERLTALAAEFDRARGSDEEHRRFQRMFEAAMLCWLEQPAGGAFESWPSFRERVSGAIQRIMAGEPGRRVAVFTSGGPIGFAVHCALAAPARSFLDVNWRVRNSSLTQFVFDRRRLTLDCFNTIPHLDDSSLWTYR